MSSRQLGRLPGPFGANSGSGQLRLAKHYATAVGDEAFRLNRELIEQAASDKYDAGRLEPHIDERIVVTAADMASPLSQKM
jgi:hypothetical protein